jgi:hypothetical protein
MNRIETLREQACIIRALLRSFDSPALRGKLLYVAKRCEELAAEAEREKREVRRTSARKRTPRSSRLGTNRTH